MQDELCQNDETSCCEMRAGKILEALRGVQVGFDEAHTTASSFSRPVQTP